MKVRIDEVQVRIAGPIILNGQWPMRYEIDIQDMAATERNGSFAGVKRIRMLQMNSPSFDTRRGAMQSLGAHRGGSDRDGATTFTRASA